MSSCLPEAPTNWLTGSGRLAACDDLAAAPVTAVGRVPGSGSEPRPDVLFYSYALCPGLPARLCLLI